MGSHLACLDLLYDNTPRLSSRLANCPASVRFRNDEHNSTQARAQLDTSKPGVSLKAASAGADRYAKTQNSSLPEGQIIAEVDRYIVWPGQALGYKLGELRVKDLRQRATAALGTKFDIHKFHNALIDDGPMPLVLLEKRVVEWIKTQQSHHKKRDPK